MARIADDEIERLKKEISVQRLAEARGIKLTRHGADLLGKCPFHDDKTPSSCCEKTIFPQPLRPSSR
jgi:DNA primase